MAGLHLKFLNPHIYIFHVSSHIYASQAIIVSVDPIDDNSLYPNAEDDYKSTPFNTPVTVPAAINDVPSTVGDTLTVTNVTNGLYGTCSIDGNGEIVYAPSTDFVGVDICPYVVCDSDGDCDTADVFIEVLPPPPIASDDSNLTWVNTPITTDVLPNDTHGLDWPLELTRITNQANTTDEGSCEIVDGQIQFIPVRGYIGTATCEYEVCVAGTDMCDTADLVVTVIPPNPVSTCSYVISLHFGCDY